MSAVFDCKTSDDVMALARRQAEWRKKLYVVSKPKPKEPTFEQLVEAAYPKQYVDHGSQQRVQRVQGPDIYPHEHKYPSISKVLDAVCAAYNCKKTDLISARRDKVAVIPRQVAQALCKHLTPRSLPEIGRRFGGRDHTTVLHAVRKMEPAINHASSELYGYASLELWAEACKRYTDTMFWRSQKRKGDGRYSK